MNVGLKFWSLNLIKESQGMMILLDLCRLKEPKNMFFFLGSCETHCPFRPAVGKCQFSKITNSKHQSGPKKTRPVSCHPNSPATLLCKKPLLFERAHGPFLVLGVLFRHLHLPKTNTEPGNTTKQKRRNIDTNHGFLDSNVSFFGSLNHKSQLHIDRVKKGYPTIFL